MKISILKNSILTFSAVLFILILWKAAALLVNSEIIVPSPESTLQSLVFIIKSEHFLQILSSTAVRVLIAFAVSCLAGITAGLLIGFNRTLDALLKPFLIMIMSTPVVSFILLALIWFKTEEIPIFVCSLIIFPIITMNVSEGIKNIDTKLIQMAKAYKVNRWRVLREIYLPSIMSYLVAGISTSIGMGWKVAVTTEVLSQPQYAVGTELQTAKVYLETSSVFAWTLVAVVLSFLMEKTIRIVESRAFKWR